MIRAVCRFVPSYGYAIDIRFTPSEDIKELDHLQGIILVSRLLYCSIIMQLICIFVPHLRAEVYMLSVECGVLSGFQPASEHFGIKLLF